MMEHQNTHLPCGLGRVHSNSGGREFADPAPYVNAIGINLEGEDQVKLKNLIAAMAYSRSSRKLIYATWVRFFDRTMTVDLSSLTRFLYILVVACQVNMRTLNLYVFPLAILIEKGVLFTRTHFTWVLHKNVSMSTEKHRSSCESL